MDFSCPNCDLTGRIDDEKLPEQGLYATCPKCKTRFLVRLEPIPPSPPIASEGVKLPSSSQKDQLVKLPETRDTNTFTNY